MGLYRAWTVGNKVRWDQETRVRAEGQDTMTRLVAEYGEGPFEIVHVLKSLPSGRDELFWQSFLASYAVSAIHTDGVVWFILKGPDGAILPRSKNDSRPTILHSGWFEPL